MRKIMILCIVLFFCGCSTNKLKKIGEKPHLDLNVIEPLELDDVKFVVVHKDNAQQIFEDMQQKNEVPVLIGMSGTDYKKLSINMKKIQNYLREQQKTIILYREYYESK